nr:26S proteasome AAA-ATPase subunit RPT1A [Andalucia godoyi]|eukprot:ANDGO_00979.mRNA.1 26S protease regulatory subunit 7
MAAADVDPNLMEDTKPVNPLDEDDIALLKHYGQGPYGMKCKSIESELSKKVKHIGELMGIKESDTGLAPFSQWDLSDDRRLMQEEQPLQVARCTKIIHPPSSATTASTAAGAGTSTSTGAASASANASGASRNAASGAVRDGSSISLNNEDTKYLINIKQMAKFVVALSEKLAPTDVEEGMRVGVDRGKYQIQLPLPPRIDPTVTMMTVEEKPDVTYNDVGGAKDQIEKLREVVELPLLHPERFVELGIDPPKGVLLYGPPGTGKTLLARAVANRTDATFIRVIGSELVQKYVGEGARMVRELFQMARQRKAAVIFFDEVDAIGGTRFDDGAGGDNEVQRTMLEIINQLDGFDARGNIKVLMATNRPDTLDPALLRPGRLDRKIEVGLPDLEGRSRIFAIHAKTMNCERGIRFELLARLCPNCTGADIRSVCTEAGMFAIRARRKVVTERDFLDSVQKVIKGYQKFSATPKYMVYN